MRDTYSVPSFDRSLESVKVLVFHVLISTYLYNAWSCSIICFGPTGSNMAAKSTLLKQKFLKIIKAWIETIFCKRREKSMPKHHPKSMGTSFSQPEIAFAWEEVYLRAAWSAHTHSGTVRILFRWVLVFKWTDFFCCCRNNNRNRFTEPEDPHVALIQHGARLQHASYALYALFHVRAPEAFRSCPRWH